MGSCGTKKKTAKSDLKLEQWPTSPVRRNTGESFRYGPDLYVNLKKTDINKYYEIQQIIGVGAFGNVKMVKQKQTGAVRAMKTLGKKKIIQEEKEKMFSEVNILRKLDHPNIMRLYELFEDDKNYYLITEYLDGGELVSRIKEQQQFSEKEAAFYMKQIFSAIYYCHSSNIVHRDLKLENLLFQSKLPNSPIKVIDFGTSRKIISKEFLSNKLGTPHYTAPEVFQGKYNEKCDLWSCGVILYILLCGYMPFNSPNPQVTIKLIEIGKYPMPEEEWSKISKEAKSLVRSLLTLDPDKRYSAEQALNDPWIQQFNSQQNALSVKVLNKLADYYHTHMIQGLLRQFIVSHVMSAEEKQNLIETFQSIDKNGDGIISKDELLKQYNELYDGDEVKCAQIVNSIFQQCDTNQSGHINFHGFLTAVVEKEVLYRQQKLTEAFNLFDLDHDGFIKKKNFEEVMGCIEIDESHWRDILEACDADNDGMISQAEFQQLLQHEFE